MGGLRQAAVCRAPAVLAYLSRNTHCAAITSSRLVAMDESGVSSRRKDYRAKGGAGHKIMTRAPQEFLRRLLLHVLPTGIKCVRRSDVLARSPVKEGSWKRRAQIC